MLGARAIFRPRVRGFMLGVSLKSISMSSEALMDNNVDRKLMATATHCVQRKIGNFKVLRVMQGISEFGNVIQGIFLMILLVSLIIGLLECFVNLCDRTHAPSKL
jgi:hypothetical protein